MRFNIPDELQDKGGIYIITNTVDQRVYIGRTRNLFKRYQSHSCALKRGSHQNLFLQFFVCCYSVDRLEFSLLEICGSKKAVERELHYQVQHRSMLVGHGFNITACGVERPPYDSGLSLNYDVLNRISKLFNPKKLMYVESTERVLRESINSLYRERSILNDKVLRLQARLEAKKQKVSILEELNRKQAEQLKTLQPGRSPAKKRQKALSSPVAKQMTLFG